MGISYVSIFVLVLLVSLFHQIGNLDEDLSAGWGTATGVLTFLFWHFVAGGSLLYLILSAVAGYGLLAGYKITVKNT